VPQFGGMRVALLLGSYYSSWVSRRDNRAPLVSVGEGFWLCLWEMKNSA